MAAGRDINSYLSSLPQYTVSLRLSLKYTQCIKALVNQILFFYRLGFSTVMKLNDPLSERGAMSRSSLQIHREDYMCLVVLIKLKIITAFLAETPLWLLLGGLSRRLSLCTYLLLDVHCVMPTEHNSKTYTPEERATKHTLKLEAFGVCLTPLKRLLNMSQL